MSKKSNMKRLRVTLKRYLILVLAMAAITTLTAACSAPAGNGSQIEGDAGVSPDQLDNKVELTLYFRNLSHDPADPESAAVIPVTRFVQKSEALARATVTELLRGPTLRESQQHSVGPLVTGGVVIDDIYIKNGICIIYLDYDGPLFAGLTVSDAEAERMFVQSVVYSLGSVPSISAVWLFHRESPWQGVSWHYFGPIAVPGRALEYTLYYRNNNNAGNFEDYIWERMITPVPFVPDGQNPFSSTGGSAGPFFEIVEKLTFSYDQEYGPTLPKDSSALEFVLHKGILTIHLAGSPPEGHQAAQVMIRSLIYTFTELPEIERVAVTINGEPFSDGDIIWGDPQGRMDLE